MDDNSSLWAEPLLAIIDLIYQISNPNDMAYEFFGRLGNLIPFDAAIFNPINWKTLELQEGICFGNTTLIPLNTESGKVSYGPLHFDLLCLTQLNVSLKLPYTASNSLIPAHKSDQQPPYQHTVGVIAGYRQYPVAAIKLFRQGMAPDFSDYEIKMLDQLTVHVANALFLQNAKTAFESNFETGLIIFDTDGKVLFKNNFVSDILAKIPLDSVLQITKNGGIWLKNGMKLYWVENVPLTPKSLLALYAKKVKPEEIPTPMADASVSSSTTQGISIFSIKPFQRRSAFENRLKRSRLSRREIDVTLKVMCGLTNSNIAKQLHIDETTVKDHLQHIYAKINIKSRTELISKLLGLDIELANHESPIAPDIFGNPS